MPKPSMLISKLGHNAKWSKEVAIEALGLVGEDAVTKKEFMSATLTTLQLYCGPKGADVGTEPNKALPARERKSLYWDLVVAWRKNKCVNPVDGGVVASTQTSAPSGANTGAKANGKLQVIDL